MKTLICLAFFFVMLSFAFAGHHGIQVGIPLPFIKIRFVDIAHLFGHHDDHHGHHGHHGFGLDLGHHGF